MEQTIKQQGKTGPQSKKSSKTGKEGAAAGLSKEALLPSEDRPNPFAGHELPLVKLEKMRPVHKIHAHSLAVSA